MHGACRFEASAALRGITRNTGLDDQRSYWCYSAGALVAARANGLPSESRHTAHRSPGWMMEPPRSRTRSSVVDRSATVKYGREAVSPGPGPRSWTPRRRLSVSVCHPDPAPAGRGVRATPRTPCQNRSARSESSAGNSMSGEGMDASMPRARSSLLPERKRRCPMGARPRLPLPRGSKSAGLRGPTCRAPHACEARSGVANEPFTAVGSGEAATRGRPQGCRAYRKAIRSPRHEPARISARDTRPPDASAGQERSDGAGSRSAPASCRGACGGAASGRWPAGMDRR